MLDYKSSQRDLDITDIYHGIQQQLAFYMAEAVHTERQVHPDKKIIPSALLYYTIDNPMLPGTKKMSDEEKEQAIRKELRLKGVIEGSEDNIRNLDENAMGDTPVLPVSFKKDGTPLASAASKVLTEEEMDGMLQYVEGMVKNIGKRINDGDKRINPMCSDKTDACKFCDFKSICRFDEKIPGYVKRDGREIDKEKAKDIVLGGDQGELYLFD